MGDCGQMAEVNSNCIVLDTLEIGDYSFDFQLHNDYLSQLESSFLSGGEVRVSARLKLREEDYDLWMEVDGDVTVTCDRCLDNMTVHVHDARDMETELDEKELDLNWLAYELIVINLPAVHCHPEGGCNPEMIALLQDHLCSTTEEPEDIEN